MIVETLTFRLASGTDVAAFLAADRRVQTEFAYRQPGLLRRTTARPVAGGDGEWIVIDQWATLADAEACDARWSSDPVAQAFTALVDPSSVRWARYETLD